jgi:hypothetical protein
MCLSFGQQLDYFWPLLVVVVLIVILMAPSTKTAVLQLVALLLMVVSYGLAIRRDGYHIHGDGHGPCAQKEGFAFDLPGAPPPYAVAAATHAPRHRPRAGPQYPGAIDVDEYDPEPADGHRDRTEGDNDYAPDGNPYNLSREAAEEAAGPCIDDEANDDELDGDERITYQARSRNDATRVTAGTMNRRRDLQKFFEEECLDSEDRQWWGRHEV